MKILHTADLHLDSPLASLAMRDPELRARVGMASRLALERMVDACIREGATALLISGDLYDQAERSMKTAAFVVRQMERLAAHDIRVFYVRGNHDALNPAAGEIRMPDNVHVFGARGERINLPGSDVWIHGVSFSEPHAPASLLPRFAAPVVGAINIALLHTSLAGAQGHDTYAPCTLADLTAAGFDYWALGHVHRRQIHASDPWVVMPGMPQGRDVGEDGPRSATWIGIANGRIAIDELATSTVEFRRVEFALQDLDSESGMERRIRERLEALAGEGGFELAILRLRLTVAESLAWRMLRDRDRWQESCAAMAAETGTLFIESLEIIASGRRNLHSPVDAVGELDALMRDISAEPAFLHEAREEMQRMLALLPREVRDRLAVDEHAAEALIRRLAENSASAMTARMRGALDGDR